MKIYRFILLLSAAFLLLPSCDEEMLDTKTNNDLSDEYIWGLPQKAEGVLMNAYNAIPMFVDHYNLNFLDVATDNAVTNDYGSAVYELGHGALSPRNQAPIGNWNQAYEQLNYINMFLKRGLRDDLKYNLDSTVSEQYKTRLRGEAYFLRAWWLAELLRVYGGISNDGQALGVPILTSPVPQDENITADLQRDTYEACAKQVFSDCDSAYKYLPIEYSEASGPLSDQNIGRANKKAALALKSRIATYAASPAYQPEDISQQQVTQKWERAARFSYEAIAEGQLGEYEKLEHSDMVGPDLSATPDEYVFRIFYNNNGMENRNLPPAFYGDGQTNPSQNLVNAFPSINGYPIGHPLADYDPQQPYQQRDERLKRTIYCNGMNLEFDGRALQIYYDNETNAPGFDAPGYFRENTRTGYYLKKWISRKPDMLEVDNIKSDFHMHPLIRRAEIYLNYAEASNQAAGPDGIVPQCDRSAVDIINEIRLKSGGITNTSYVSETANKGKKAFNELILNERRLELAFENHRYFDLRRWKMDLNQTIYGTRIEKNAEGLVYQGTNPLGDQIPIEKREFNGSRYYYTPIPYGELAKSPDMKNNKGW